MIPKPQAVLTEAQVAKACSWLDQVEQGVDQLLAGKPKISDNELDNLRGAIARCKDYAWALKTFPVFDLGGLSIRKLQKVGCRVFVMDRERGEHKAVDIEVELNLPAFASIEWSPKGGRVEQDLASLGESQKNSAAIAKALQAPLDRIHLELYRTRLQAECPTPPASVVKNVEHVRGRFDELTIAYEAEWAAAPVRDPLVLGRIAMTWFLIDEYDASKLERYIASEFTRRPKT